MAKIARVRKVFSGTFARSAAYRRRLGEVKEAIRLGLCWPEGGQKLMTGATCTACDDSVTRGARRYARTSSIAPRESLPLPRESSYALAISSTGATGGPDAGSGVYRSHISSRATSPC